MGQLERDTHAVEVLSAEQVLPVVEREAFLDAMASLPSAVSLVTTGEGAARLGLTVSALSSLSTEPPSVLVCVNKSASAHQALIDNGAFAVNVLGSEQGHLASLFAQRGVERFASEQWQQGELNVPVLEGALINLQCRLERAVDGFSHSILIGVVEQVRVANEEAVDPLIWHQRGFRRVSSL